ncbi:MAG TPA: XdhC family protein, partial [Bacteroidota bacterium]|nr:XdhC family protein [Bacteroidota bacterium]
ASGKPILVTYDSSSPGDILWGLGLGCTGIAHVLLERVSGTEPCRALEFIGECRALRTPGAIASVYAIDGCDGERTGSRVFVRDGLPATARPSDTALGAALGRACAGAISARKSSQLNVTLPGGRAEAFIEYLPPPVSLFVFGAGPDAAPLVSLATDLGWIVAVVDGRPAYLTRESFPSADELILAHPGDTAGAITFPPEAAAVVMTHNFNNDLVLVRTLLGSTASYIGLLGPRAKADLLLARLAEEGLVPADDQLARLHCPVGLDIGAETPGEIALAIVAEIQAMLQHRPGSCLSRRDGPIHR